MQVDELERIKLGYYFGNLESEQANLQLILQKTSTIVRAEVDIYERIANKGLNDLILEPMTTQGPDPYNSYPTTDEFSSIFSILPPTPIIPTSGAGATGASTPQQPESIMSNFYGYHEANPFSTARNQTNAVPRDRHLFGESSSAESNASMINKAAAAGVVTATVTVNGTHPSSTNAAVTDKTKTVKDTPATNTTAKVAAQVQKTLPNTENNGDSAKQQQQQHQKNQPTDATKEPTPYSPSPEKAIMALKIQELETEVTEEATSKLKGPEESAEGQETQNPEADAVVEAETDNQVTKESSPALSASSSSQGVDLQSGHQFHRHQNLSKHTNDLSHSASSPSELSSSVQSYTLGSRSGSKAHPMLSSTPDSLPVRGIIHIAQDSELLNNSDFTFSYDPAELLNQRGHHLSRQAFAEFNALEEEEEGGFGATPSSTRQPSETLRHHSGRDTLRHSSSDSQLSHSSSNLSSFASSTGGSLSHRRSTGRMKTGLESSASAVMFGTSVEEPFLTAMKQQVGVADHIRELGRGFDDGMPAFFADEIDEMEDSLVAGRPTQQTHGFAIGHTSRRGSGSDQGHQGSMEKRLRDSNHSLDSILMADGSSKNVSTTQVNEITA
ncbi:hypothetical protein BG011_008225 [Mortierella polycephala]|uniref:Uncharacterized protein n=1 Tax=Mortierella polycephala TaxID=41804 RepID=A0A9P6PQ10_9FUNG|nr:hypothetical protein BG011_008225 [Mortierella polycephala]